MKRWFSVEGDNRTDHSNVIQPYAVRQLPLPAIPEASSKSNSFPRQRENVNKTLSIRENVYDEIGPDLLRRSHIYNPLLLAKPLAQHGEQAYDSIRSSTLPTRGSSKRLQIGITDNYFVLEPTISEKTHTDQSLSDNYFILEKDNTQVNDNNISSEVQSPKDSSISDSRRKHSDDIAADPEERQQLLGSVSSEETKGGNNNLKPVESDNYFLLEKIDNKATHPDDYLEPLEKHRHSYIDVMSEHDKLMQVKSKHMINTQPQDTRL